MEEATPFASPSNIHMTGHIGTVEYGGGDRGMVAIFFNKAVHNPAKSMEHGRPVYENQTFIRVHPPGERLNIVERPANDSDRRRWPIQWAQFQQNRQQIPEGTPVDLLYPDHPAIAATLRANNVHTIEQLAELSANAIEAIGMGAQRWVNDGKDFMAKANKGVTITQHRKDLEDRDREIATLKRLIEEQAQQIQMMTSQRATEGINLMDLQKLLAGLQGRPQFPQQNFGSQQGVPSQFDAATAQINATHDSNLGPTRRARRKTG